MTAVYIIVAFVALSNLLVSGQTFDNQMQNPGPNGFTDAQKAQWKQIHEAQEQKCLGRFQLMRQNAQQTGDACFSALFNTYDAINATTTDLNPFFKGYVDNNENLCSQDCQTRIKMVLAEIYQPGQDCGHPPHPNAKPEMANMEAQMIAFMRTVRDLSFQIVCASDASGSCAAQTQNFFATNNLMAVSQRKQHRPMTDMKPEYVLGMVDWRAVAATGQNMCTSCNSIYRDAITNFSANTLLGAVAQELAIKAKFSQMNGNNNQMPGSQNRKQHHKHHGPSGMLKKYYAFISVFNAACGSGQTGMQFSQIQNVVSQLPTHVSSQPQDLPQVQASA